MARDAIARSLLKYERQISGFSSDAGLLVGLESRSSGPIRQPRDRDTLLVIMINNILSLVIFRNFSRFLAFEGFDFLVFLWGDFSRWRMRMRKIGLARLKTRFV